MKKTDSISPFEKGGKSDTSTLLCVTVQLPVEKKVPHPLPGLSFTVFGRKGVGGGETSSARQGGARVTGPHPAFPETIMMAAILPGAKDVLSFCPGLQLHY